MALSELKSSILIAGNDNGLGLILAQRLSVLGHKVILVSKSHVEVERECEHLKTWMFDLEIENDRIALYERVLNDLPKLNVLINNTGTCHFLPPLLDTNSSAWILHEEEIVSTLMTPMYLTSLFTPHMIKHAYALIVNVSSVFSFAPLVNFPAFSAANAGLHSFTQSLRHELKDTSVRVVEVIAPPLQPLPNEVSPATPHLNMLFPSSTDKGAVVARSVEEFGNVVLREILMGHDEVYGEDANCESLGHFSSRDDLESKTIELNANKSFARVRELYMSF